MIQPPPQRVLWVYSEWQPLFDEIPKDKSPVIISFTKNIPKLSFFDSLRLRDRFRVWDRVWAVG